MSTLITTIRCDDGEATVPVDFVPTPTAEYRTFRKLSKATRAAGPPVPIPTPIPLPFPVGSRVLIFKQDPSVTEIGVRKAFLPARPLTGPVDGRIQIAGLPPVVPNVFGDFIASPGSEAFDSVHTFAIVRMVLNMYQRARLGVPIPWQWNSTTDTTPVRVFPRAGEGQNAFYSRSQRALSFLHFLPPGTPPKPRCFTCRSFDIVAHEAGHAILDGLKPGWLGFGNPPQTGGLHESFGDLTAIFLALAQLDQCEAIIVQTKSRLHDKTFLSDVAEEFGLALGRPNGLRNADNDLKLSETGNEVHAISQVFTGAVYDILADIFAFERAPSRKDDAQVLFEVGQYMCSLVLRSLIAAPNTGATYADVANAMVNTTIADGKPASYRNAIRNRFSLREVVVTALDASLTDESEELKMAPAWQDAPGAVADFRGCCGTMTLPENFAGDELLEPEIEELRQSLREARLGDGAPKASNGHRGKGASGGKQGVAAMR